MQVARGAFMCLIGLMPLSVAVSVPHTEWSDPLWRTANRPYPNFHLASGSCLDSEMTTLIPLEQLRSSSLWTTICLHHDCTKMPENAGHLQCRCPRAQWCHPHADRLKLKHPDLARTSRLPMSMIYSHPHSLLQECASGPDRCCGYMPSSCHR